MHVITKRALRLFWTSHKDAETPLRAWFSVFSKTDFGNFADIKRAWPSTDKVGRFTVFDIGGNKYRLIAVVHYQTRKIYIRGVFTHKDYDRGHWKRE